MINEYTYYIGITFISWVVAIFMLTGFLTIKSIESQLKSGKVDSAEEPVLEAFINQYYSHSFIEKVVTIMKLGSAMCVATFMNIIKIFKKGE